jgi:hypothetical protein
MSALRGKADIYRVLRNVPFWYKADIPTTYRNPYGCVPIRSGIGLQLGANLGWLKFTDGFTWNPF